MCRLTGSVYVTGLKLGDVDAVAVTDSARIPADEVISGWSPLSPYAMLFTDLVLLETPVTCPPRLGVWRVKPELLMPLRSRPSLSRFFQGN